MFRNIALLLLTGCNVVFGLEEQEVAPAVCGPYGAPTAIAFTDVTDPVDFSVDGSGTHALVKASYKGAIARYLAVVATGGDTFAFDPLFDKNLPDLQNQAFPIYAAHLNFAPNHRIVDGSVDTTALADMFVGQRTAGDVAAYHYTLHATGGWTPAEPAVDAPSGQDVIPFDDLEEASSVPNLFARRLIVVRVDPDSAMRTLDLDLRNPGDANWRAQTGGGGLPIAAQINAQHSVEQAVLAHAVDDKGGNPLIVIYSASPATSPSDPPALYLSLPATTGFPLGEAISVQGMTGEMHEPWTSPDCTQLWFRSGSTIYHAQAL